MRDYEGSCHCGAVRFTVRADPAFTTSCDCTLCIKKNARMIQVPLANLTVTAGEDRLATYAWNMRIAKHHFCTRCGIYTFHRRRADPNSYGVNVYCLDGFDPNSVPHRCADGATMSVAE
jgi:hypothetical protein